MANWVRVAAIEDCPPGRLKGVHAEGHAIVLANVEGDLYALEDRCSHDDYPLSDGELDDGEVVCAYHGARFDACTGARRALPAIRPVRSFPVEIREGGVFVDLS